MAFDFKKEFKEYYLPPSRPEIITLPRMNYIAVSGKGDPNKEDGEYKRGLELLYVVAYALRMSYKGDYKIKGFFEYVVPPPEGLWWTEDGVMDHADKSNLCFVSMIRLPDFVSEKDVAWAITEAGRKRKIDCTRVNFFSYEEGLCVQCMHLGSYDTENETIDKMSEYARAQGYEIVTDEARRHHEIYMSDPRKVSADKLKTVLRLPIR